MLRETDDGVETTSVEAAAAFATLTAVADATSTGSCGRDVRLGAPGRRCEPDAHLEGYLRFYVAALRSDRSACPSVR